MMSSKGKVSQAFIGRSLGLSGAASTKLKKQGMPVDSVESAKAGREQWLNVAARKPVPAAVRPAPMAMEEDHQAARTRREIAEANLAEMREAEERGDLIRVSVVKSTLSRLVSSTRESLLQMPLRQAQVLSVESDPDRVRDILDKEINQALSQLVTAYGKDSEQP